MGQLFGKLAKIIITCAAAGVIAYFTGHFETFKNFFHSARESVVETAHDIRRETQKIDTEKLKKHALRFKEEATTKIKKEASKAAKTLKEKATKLKNGTPSSDDDAKDKESSEKKQENGTKDTENSSKRDGEDEEDKKGKE